MIAKAIAKVTAKYLIQKLAALLISLPLLPLPEAQLVTLHPYRYSKAPPPTKTAPAKKSLVKREMGTRS